MKLSALGREMGRRMRNMVERGKRLEKEVREEAKTGEERACMEVELEELEEAASKAEGKLQRMKEEKWKEVKGKVEQMMKLKLRELFGMRREEELEEMRKKAKNLRLAWKHSEAIKMFKEVYLERKELKGEDDIDTLKPGCELAYTL